jgi:uncharacterized protein DUF6152
VKTKVLMIVVVFAGLAAMTVPLFAHHGAASFELGAPVVLKNALITEFAWINPHPLYVWQAKTKEPVGRFNKVEFSDGTVLRDTQRGADDGGRADTGVRQ